MSRSLLVVAICFAAAPWLLAEKLRLTRGLPPSHRRFSKRPATRRRREPSRENRNWKLNCTLPPSSILATGKQ